MSKKSKTTKSIQDGVEKSTHFIGEYLTDVGTIKTLSFAVLYEKSNEQNLRIGGQIEFSQVNYTPSGNFKIDAGINDTWHELKQVKIHDEDLPNGEELQPYKKYRFTAKARTKKPRTE